MSLDVSAVMSGFQTRLDTITGLRVSDGWPDQLNVPCAFPVLGSVGQGGVAIEDRTFDGGFVVNVDVIVLVSQTAGLGRAQRALHDYADDTGGTSIRAAVLGDTTLGGEVSDIIPGPVSGYREYAHIGNEYLGMAFSYRVLV